MSTGVLLGTDMVKSRFIERRIKELTDGFIVADAIFMRDPSDTPAITYEENTTGLNGDERSAEVEQRVESGKYPRIGMTATEKSALIKDYGLAAPVTYDAIRFNRINSIQRAYITLGNSLVKFVDNKGLTALTDGYNASSTRINTLAVGTAWNVGTSDPFADLMRAKGKVDIQGYSSNVAILNVDDYTTALTNKDFRLMLDTDVPPDRKIAHSGVLKGQVAGLVILVSNTFTKGKFWVGQDQVVGNRSETNNGVETHTYKQDNSPKSDTIVEAFREVEFYLTDPKAGCLATGN